MTIELKLKEKVSEGFLKVYKLLFDQKTFSGGKLENVQREVLFRPNPVAFLMVHDSKSEKVLLVKQIRPSTIIDNKENLFVIEPVAGIIDDGEQPLQAAVREGIEETGITISPESIVKIGEGYISPGITNEYGHFFKVDIDLSNVKLGNFGEGSEQEDIQTMLVSYSELDALIADPSIATSIPLLLLQKSF